MEMSLHPAKCTMWCAIRKQGIFELIFVEGTITNQWYLQQLQNEVIPVIQGAGHVDTTFFQQDGAQPHRVNVIFDVTHDVFGSCVP
jgi:outer membrane protein W